MIIDYKKLNTTLYTNTLYKYIGNQKQCHYVKKRILKQFFF